MAKEKISEVELAQHFVDYYRDYDVYKEVPMSGGRCDIVVKSAPVIICVEVKLTLNVDVIYQATRHMGKCHYSYIAIPYDRVTSNGAALCEQLGIGILAYFGRGRPMSWYMERIAGPEDKDQLLMVKEVQRPVYRRAISPPRLHESMKLSTAGEQHNTMSEFKVTLLEIKAHLQSMPGQKVRAKEFFEKKGRFHYSTTQSARQCITRLAANGQIPELEYEGGWLILKSPAP